MSFATQRNNAPQCRCSGLGFRVECSANALAFHEIWHSTPHNAQHTTQAILTCSDETLRMLVCAKLFGVWDP